MINPRINLLPWRERNLLFANRKFGLQVTIVFGIGLFLCFLSTFVVGTLIENRKLDLVYLEEEISGLRVKIREIRGLKEQKELLLNKMNIIRELQADRINIVRLFNNIATSVPDGLVLTKIDRKFDAITISGYSESSTFISTFMRNLEHHKILTETDLNQIKSRPEGDFDFLLETIWGVKKQDKK